MPSTSRGAAKLALAVVVGLIALKATVAAITGSISITAQAADSFLDLFAIVVTFLAVNMSTTPADAEHPFGHGKVEGVAAVVQALLILTAAGLIIYSAVQRIISGAAIALTEAGIAVMAVSIIASILLSRHLFKVSRNTGSLALEAFARNIAADVYSAAGVLVGLTVVRFTGLSILDPIVALGVTLFILKAAYNVIRTSFGELVDTKLPQAEEEKIIASLLEHREKIADYHKVRTRKAGSQRFVDLHLVMPKNVSLEEAHSLCDSLEREIEDRLQQASVTIHAEPCDEGCEQCLISDCTLRLTIELGQQKTRRDKTG
jgi:cation diffusion facilitator family transporter